MTVSRELNLSTSGEYVLIIDVGSSSIRVSAIDQSFNFINTYSADFLPVVNSDGIVEFNASELRSSVLSLCEAAINAHGTPKGIAITNQRASTIVWDRQTADPVFNGISWQDLRTVGDCLGLQAEGIRLAPNVSATKLAYILNQDTESRKKDLCFGTIESYIIFCLSRGGDKNGTHITDPSNVALTGMFDPDTFDWSDRILSKLDIPKNMLPRVVNSCGELAIAFSLKGSPLICGALGDQQASLLGQACVSPGDAKATFGTGAMLDQLIDTSPKIYGQSPNGTIPVVAWSLQSGIYWALEAVMLAAGSNIQWLKDGLGLIDDVSQASFVDPNGYVDQDIFFVPALSGLGTPNWDFGASGAFFGLSLATDKNGVILAVLNGIANLAADMKDAAVNDSALPIESLKIDGGMTKNHVFCQLLANACQIPVEVSPVVEATTLGAAYLAYYQLGLFDEFSEIKNIKRITTLVEPNVNSNRDRWNEAKSRALKWIPELSGITF